MTVKLDSGKTTEISPEEARHIEYGNAIKSLKNGRAERIIATGDGLTPQTFQVTTSKTEIALYTNSSQQDFSTVKEMTPLNLTKPAS